METSVGGADSLRESPSATPSPQRQQALITLLADEDERVHRAIQTELAAGGENTIRWMRRHIAHNDPQIRRAVKSFLAAIDVERHDNAFILFCLSSGENLDLEEGVWRFVLTHYPDANPTAYRAQLDEWAGAVREKLDPGALGASALRAMNQHLYSDLGFKGSTESFFDPQNSYLNRVMDLRAGIPITLCILYMLLARRLDLPISGIGMPGHFLCRYQTAFEEYYIDAFHAGLLMSRADARRRLDHYNLENDERPLQPVSTRRILQRMISNVHLIRKEKREEAAAEKLQRYLVALAR